MTKFRRVPRANEIKVKSQKHVHTRVYIATGHEDAHLYDEYMLVTAQWSVERRWWRVGAGGIEEVQDGRERERRSDRPERQLSFRRVSELHSQLTGKCRSWHLYRWESHSSRRAAACVHVTAAAGGHQFPPPHPPHPPAWTHVATRTLFAQRRAFKIARGRSGCDVTLASLLPENDELLASGRIPPL